MRAAILLAAGRSRRFHGANKLLARHRGRVLVEHALAAARLAPVGRIIVVVGHDRWRIAARVDRPRATLIFARDHRAGLAASLRAGLRALRANEREVFIFLGDMLAVPPTLPARLARAMRPGIAAVRPRGRDGPGHPVLLRRPDRATIDRLGGDSGLGALIAGRTRWIATKDRRPPDIDTRRDLARWR
jgi:molybdenum cofactor cytidylyltransferase